MFCHTDLSRMLQKTKKFRFENETKREKLAREKELSMELASTVSRLKDQIQIQMDSFQKLESNNEKLKRKAAGYQDELSTQVRYFTKVKKS